MGSATFSLSPDASGRNFLPFRAWLSDRFRFR
jgi:hypothetical protein